MDRQVIDLSGDSPPASSERSRDKGERRRKRRRLDAAALRSAVELSDGEDEELVADHRLARRMQDEERSHCRVDPDADLALARRLQEEEEQRAQRSPPRFAEMFGRGGALGLPPPGARGSHWDWLGSLARSRPGDDWLGGLLGAGPPGAAPFGPGHAGLLGRGGMPALPPHLRRPGGGQFGHLEFMDRDFGEADYEMLLRLDEDRGREEGREKKKRRAGNNTMLDQLPCRRASKSDAKSDATCAICLEDFRANQSVTTLPCKHEYHKSCILKWLKSCDAPSCPTCKAPVLGTPSPEHCPGVSSSTGGVVSSTDDAAAEDEGKEQWWHTT